MTLIKCFTNSHTDNIRSALRLAPEKLILVGNGVAKESSISRYRRLLQHRGLSTAVSAWDTHGQDFESLYTALRELVLSEGEAVMDLTGGDETAVMAVGAVLAALDLQTRRQIRVERFDRTADCVINCLNGARSLHQEQVALTVDELIALHGGIVHPGSCQPPENCTPKDLEKLWKMVAEDPKGWNSSIKVLHEFERHSENRNKTHIFVALSDYDVLPLSEDEDTLRSFLEKLQRCGVLVDNSSRNYLDYTYTNPLMRLCTEKAGNVLELKTLLEGQAATVDGAPFFQDCRMGVVIDWDGVIHDPSLKVKETRNEIDVVLMHGCTPLFISCKNGNIDDEELYKLHTVTQHFGGAHAGKMLIATDLDLKSIAANDSFTRRAWDMDIFLEENAAKLSGEDWAARFRSAML